jgi:regulator of replication initiation timing
MKIPKQLKNDLRELFAIEANKLEEALQDLRIHIQYLLFDNESLRRENKYLRKLLEERDR